MGTKHCVHTGSSVTAELVHTAVDLGNCEAGVNPSPSLLSLGEAAPAKGPGENCKLPLLAQALTGR